MLDAGVVDEDVERAEALFAGAHHGLDFGRLAHIGAVVVDLAARACRTRDLGARRLHLAEAVEHQSRAGLGQRAGQPQADAAGGAGDEGRPALKGFAVHPSFLLPGGRCPQGL